MITKKNLLIALGIGILAGCRGALVSQRTGLESQINFIPQSMRYEDKLLSESVKAIHKDKRNNQALSQVSHQAGLSKCLNVTQIPMSECMALIDLWNSTKGQERTHNENWLQTNEPCDWYGITCQEFDGQNHVRYIYMYNNNLQGVIPQSIGNFPYLAMLNLSYNREKLYGPIPSSIGNLSNLTSLTLVRNALSGPIPQSIGNLSNLQVLQLGDNQLGGTIPDTITNLTELIDLSLQINNLSGPIPNKIGNLTHLIYLQLYINQLGGTIPESVKHLVNLQQFNIVENQICGKIPESMMNLPQLQSVSVIFNRLQSQGYSQPMTQWLETHLGPDGWSVQNPQLCPASF